MSFILATLVKTETQKVFCLAGLLLIKNINLFVGVFQCVPWPSHGISFFNVVGEIVFSVTAPCLLL